MDKKIALLEGMLIDLNDKIIKEELKQTVIECIAMIGQLKEGFIDDHNGPLEKELDDMLRQIETAKKALAIANRLPPSHRKNHQSKLFGFLNKLRLKRDKVADRVYTNSPASKLSWQNPSTIKPIEQDDSKLPPLWRKQASGVSENHRYLRRGESSGRHFRDESGVVWDDEGHSNKGHTDFGRNPAPASQNATRLYHAVAFKDREAAKNEGMRWDNDKKKWYHTDARKSATSNFVRN